jgi:hypothetical protein
MNKNLTNQNDQSNGPYFANEKTNFSNSVMNFHPTFDVTPTLM